MGDFLFISERRKIAVWCRVGAGNVTAGVGISALQKKLQKKQ
jgi:hypothetical protein